MTPTPQENYFGHQHVTVIEPSRGWRMLDWRELWAYRELQNVFLLPHLGSATVDTRNAMGFKALDNLDAFFAGKPLPARVV